MNLKQLIAKTLANIYGWRTNKKFVVIESDDWGSIRMPSKKVYEKCLNAGYGIDLNFYERYDALESEDDLEALFALLKQHTDQKGNYPVFTANCLVANPDFDKINASHFSEYFYESVVDTFQKYPKHKHSFDLWMHGNEQGIFHPQYHGREHLNVSLFMEALQNGNKDVLFGFENKMPGCIKKQQQRSGNFYVEATMFRSKKDKEQKLAYYVEGLDLFETLIGYKSASIIPPNYTWSNDFDAEVFKKGVACFQGSAKMREPGINQPNRYHRHYTGERNSLGQTYLVRNCSFEPSLNPQINSVTDCLKEIQISFALNKPAIICSHRVNYIGFIDESNRSKSLQSLDQLLSGILEKWPDVEFITSDALGNLINAN